MCTAELHPTTLRAFRVCPLKLHQIITSNLVGGRALTSDCSIIWWKIQSSSCSFFLIKDILTACSAASHVLTCISWTLMSPNTHGQSLNSLPLLLTCVCVCMLLTPKPDKKRTRGPRYFIINSSWTLSVPLVQIRVRSLCGV